MKTIKTRNEIILNQFNFHDNLKSYIDLDYLLNNNEVDSIEKLSELIQEEIYTCEIIYYLVAIDYLKENDPSLKDSLEIAKDLGFEMDYLNSELLATLLLQQVLSEDLYTFINEIEEEEIFN